MIRKKGLPRRQPPACTPRVAEIKALEPSNRFDLENNILKLPGHVSKSRIRATGFSQKSPSIDKSPKIPFISARLPHVHLLAAEFDRRHGLQISG